MASLSFLATLLVCISGLVLLTIQLFFLKTPQPEQISLACTGKLKIDEMITKDRFDVKSLPVSHVIQTMSEFSVLLVNFVSCSLA